MNSKQTARGFNGRRITLVVVGSLLSVLLVFGYLLWLFSRLERSREQATDAWRSVAAELSVRHRTIEMLVAQGVDNQIIDIALGEKFRLAIDTFATTTQIDKQIIAAEEVELQLAAIRESLADRPEAAKLPDASKLPQLANFVARWDQVVGKPTTLAAAIEAYATVIRNQQDLRLSLGGKLLLFFVKLGEPREFRIMSVLPNSRIL